MADVMGYLTSPKNAVGLVLAAAAVAITGPVGLGVAAPIVAGAAVSGYGLGAVLTPTRRSGGGSVGRVSGSLSDLGNGVEAMARKYTGPHMRAQLPLAASAALESIIASLREVVGQAERLRTSPDTLHVVSRTIDDYVPTTLDTYLALPVDVRDVPTPTGKAPSAQVVDQMQILQREMERVKASLTAQDYQSLETQGRFLEDKFHQSGLD